MWADGLPVTVQKPEPHVPSVCHRLSRQVAFVGRVFGLSLAERLVRLPDPRHRRGVRHPFVAVLLIAASAVVAGARSYTAIGQWARSAPQRTLARLGARLLTSLNVWIAPSRSTLRRIVSTVCPGGLADLTGEVPAGVESVAADGKSARGSRHGQTPAAHLLAAMTSDGQTITQPPSYAYRTGRMKSPASPPCWPPSGWPGSW